MIIDRNVFLSHINQAEHELQTAEVYLEKTEIMTTGKYKEHYCMLVRIYIGRAKAQLTMAKLYIK